jgi:hypothetical protein
MSAFIVCTVAAEGMSRGANLFLRSANPSKTLPCDYFESYMTRRAGSNPVNRLVTSTWRICGGRVGSSSDDDT